jgi:hypothetical protein
MADTKEFESLDALFRKTFDNLPDAPAASGWDAPSEQVWQHVQTQIKPPRSGWSTQTLTLIAAFAVTIAVGLYLFLNRPTQQEAPATAPPPVAAETTELQTASVQEQTAEMLPVAPEAPGSTSKSEKKKTATAKKETPRSKTGTEAAKSTETGSSTESAEKPSGKKIVSPNTTERRKAELARRAKESWETPLQTLPQRWPGKTKN